MENLEKEFTKMVREHKDTIYMVCYMFSKDNAEVEDLYQEILINLWRSMPQFEGRSSVKTWIWRISLNTCISIDRKIIEIIVELGFLNAIEALCLLLFTQLQAVVGHLGLSALTVLAGSISTTGDCALIGIATLALQEQFLTFSAALTAHSTSISCHYRLPPYTLLLLGGLQPL
ncbi:MAG: RNA polymerase sigma factor [Alistipes sp.]|nr:RNA polymerase sigma factor [Alistipes sp.]